MATKVKYDVSKVDDPADFKQPTPGMYRAKVVEVGEPKHNADKGHHSIEVVLEINGHKEFKGAKLWTYPIPDSDHEFVQGKFKEFIKAMGLRAKGTLDLDKIVGTEVQAQVVGDKDLNDEYRARVKKLLPLVAADEEEEDEPDEDEDEEGEEEVELDDLTRAELKELIKENELGIRVLKSMSDDALRAAIAEAMGEEEEEEEDEEAEDDYDDLGVQDLKDQLKERGLKTGGSKAQLIKRLREDDADEEDPF